MATELHEAEGVHRLSDRRLGDVSPLSEAEERVLDDIHRRMGYNNAILMGSVFDDPGVVGTDIMEHIERLFSPESTSN